MGLVFDWWFQFGVLIHVQSLITKFIHLTSFCPLCSPPFSSMFWYFRFYNKSSSCRASSSERMATWNTFFRVHMKKLHPKYNRMSWILNWIVSITWVHMGNQVLEWVLWSKLYCDWFWLKVGNLCMGDSVVNDMVKWHITWQLMWQEHYSLANCE